MEWNESLKGLITAIGIGLMIGAIRERNSLPEANIAGIRTHALIAVLGSLSWIMGLIPFAIVLMIIGAFAIVGYVRTSNKDIGLTAEVTMVITCVLSAFAQQNAMLTAALGVLCAILLKAKSSIHKVSKEIITEQELGEALLILGSALIVLPLLPSKAIDPWGVIELNTIWRIVVLIMAMGMFGHIARRALGDRFGLPVAGFFSGLASSTAAIASLGQRASQDKKLLFPASAAALLANLSSLILFFVVIGTVSPHLLASTLIPAFAASLTLLIVSAVYFFAHRPINEVINQTTGQSFKLSHALIIALAISLISIISVWLNDIIGSQGALVALSIVSLVEIHGAAVSLAQLTTSEAITLETARWGVVWMVAASSVAKSILSFVSGGKQFGIQVTVGMIAMVVALVFSLLF